MKTIHLLTVLFIFMFISCKSHTNSGTSDSSHGSGIDRSGSMESWRQEIMHVERDFAAMAESDGIPEAFLHFAAEDAVLMRGDQLIIGRPELVDHFDRNPSTARDEKLSWKPDFVDVSASGDLAYTYGPYIYSYADSTGARVEHKGIFHTVWKRQSDGSWRFVWD